MFFNLSFLLILFVERKHCNTWTEQIKEQMWMRHYRTSWRNIELDTNLYWDYPWFLLQH
jgi:hypothetical protein